MAKVLELAGIEVLYFLATTEETFDRAFTEISDAILGQLNPHTSMPFVHISAHGGPDGLELTDGDLVLWEKLDRLLEQLHKKVGPILMPPNLNQNLPKTTVCLSSCGAYSAYSLGSINKPEPYQSLIGPNKDVGWCEALIAFSTFYYQTMVLHKSFLVAVMSMNFASGAVFKNDEGEPTYCLTNPHETENLK